MAAANPNIVLVTFDSLRADHCGFVRGGADLTPTLDRLAADGFVYDRAIAPGPRTPTAVPEFLTGKVMSRHDSESRESKLTGMRDHVARHRTIADRLSDLGYATAAFSANPWAAERTGIASEFDEFLRIDRPAAETIVHKPGFSALSGTRAGTFLYYLESWLRKQRNFAQWPQAFDDIVDGIAGLEEPYFAWIFLMDTHNPYIVPREDRVESSTIGMYYGLVRGNASLNHGSESYLDDEMPSGVARRLEACYRDATRSIDRFVDELTTALAEDDPTYVVHADHGEAFGEHGRYGHQNVLYEENIHVPLLVTGGEDVPNERVAEPTSLRELPDLIENIGLPGEEFVGHGSDTARAITRTWKGDTIAVRGQRWKYVETNGDGELYDLSVDPQERRDVSDHHRDVRDERARLVEEFRGEFGDHTGGDSESVALSANAKQRLETLGYRQ